MSGKSGSARDFESRFHEVMHLLLAAPQGTLSLGPSLLLWLGCSLLLLGEARSALPVLELTGFLLLVLGLGCFLLLLGEA